MIRRAVTLIELMIALAILLTIAAIAAPIVITELDERAFVNAMDTIERQILLVRAESQLRGETIEVVYQPDPPRVIARRFDADPGNHLEGFSERQVDPLLHDSESIAAASVRRPASARSEPPPMDADDVVIAVRELDGGVTISLTEPEAPPGPGTVEPIVSATDPTRPPEPEEHRLLLYVPDGSALLARRFWLVDERDRQARVDVSAWTGQPRATRLPPRGTQPLVPDSADSFLADEEAAPEWQP